MGGLTAFDALRERAKRGRDPACADETLQFLLQTAERICPRRILEIGAGEGLTSIALLCHSAAEVTAIELDPARADAARRNAETFGVAPRFHLLEGDAGVLLPTLGGPFDMIFLDGPKVQYRRYFPDCKRLLPPGGVLLCDDVLLFGWVRGEAPLKRRMLAEHLREFLRLLEGDPDFTTEILPLGEGLSVSVKRGEEK